MAKTSAKTSTIAKKNIYYSKNNLCIRCSKASGLDAGKGVRSNQKHLTVQIQEGSKGCCKG